MEKIKFSKKQKRLAMKGILNERFNKFNITTKIFIVLYKLLQILSILTPATMMLLKLNGSKEYSILSFFVTAVVLYVGSVICHILALDSSNIKYNDRAEEYIVYTDNKIEYCFIDISRVSQNISYKYIIPTKEIKEIKYDKKTKEIFLKWNIKMITYKSSEVTDERTISNMTLLNIFDKNLKDNLMAGLKRYDLKKFKNQIN